MRYIIFLLSIGFFLASCGNSKKSSTTDQNKDSQIAMKDPNIKIPYIDSSYITDTITRYTPSKEEIQAKRIDSLMSIYVRPTKDELGGYPITYDHPQKLMTLSVINREGADEKQEPDEDSQCLGHKEFGDYADVIEITDEYYGIRDRFVRVKERGVITSGRLELLFVKKSDLGTNADIQLIDSELNVATVNEEDDVIPQNFLKVEFVSEDVFLEKGSNEVYYLSQDEENVSKDGNILTLSTKAKDVVLEDKPTDNESEVYHEYKGEYKSLNQFVIYNYGWEWVSYSFYDMKTGEKQDFISKPYLSPDKKHLFVVEYDPYTNTTTLELHKVDKNGKANRLVYGYYEKWNPHYRYYIENNEQTNMFWSEDGCFYIEVVHSRTWGNENLSPQYIKISLVEG